MSYGIDFSDESYYVALAYRFALGDIPFHDELHLVQSAALLTWPMVEAYLWIYDSTDGIVLFMRRGFLAFQCGIGTIAFLALRTLAPWPVALSISLLTLALVPFGIPSLSYNTLGSGLFAAGAFIALPWIEQGRARPGRMLASGTFHGLAMVAYPPLAIPVVIFSGVLLWLATAQQRVVMGAYWGAVAAIGAGLIVIAQPEGLLRVHDFMTIRYPPDPAKLPRALVQFATRLPNPLLLLAGFGVLFWQRQRRPWIALICLPLVAFALAWPLRRLELSVAPLLYVTSMGWLAPLLLPWVYRDARLKRLFVGLWLPSVCAGLTFAWASTNGYLNAGLGMLPAAAVTLLFLERAMRQAVDSTTEDRLAIVPVIGVLVFVGVLLSYQRGLYRGDSILTDRLRIVTWGPFAGLRGHPIRDDFLQTLADDLEPLDSPGSRVLFYDHFPAGYLLTAMRPATPSIFGCFLLTADAQPSFCSTAVAGNLSGPVVAVRVPTVEVLGNRFRKEQASDRDTERLVAERLVPLVSRRDRQQRLLYEISVSPPRQTKR